MFKKSLFILILFLIPIHIFAQNNNLSCVNILKSYKSGNSDKKDNTKGDIRLLQDFLYKNKYIKSKATGYFGFETKKAILKFQKEEGLKTTGILDQKTSQIIRQKTCSVEQISETEKYPVSVEIIKDSSDLLPGGVMDFKWYGGSEKDRLTIYIENKQGVKFNSKYVGSGGDSARLNISSNIESGEYYLSVINDKGLKVGESQFFNITAELSGLIRIMSPNGSEILYTDKEYRISWFADQRVLFDNIDISLKSTDGKIVRKITQNVPNTQYYNWIVSKDIPEGLYSLEVSARRGSIVDQSDFYFSIKK